MNMPAKLQGSFLNSLPIFPNIFEGYKVQKKISDNWTIDRDEMSLLRSWLWFLRKVQYYNCNEDLLSSWWRAHKVFSLLHHFTGPTRSWWSSSKHYEQRKITKALHSFNIAFLIYCIKITPRIYITRPF